MTAFTDDPVLTEVTAATDRLLVSMRGLADSQVAHASRCAGWTRGHVATHVARNADGLINLLSWAATGVEIPMYPSREVRDAQIEAGAARTSSDLQADVDSSAERFLGACAELPEPALDAVVRLGSGRELVARDIPWMRLREVEIHHVDLDAGYDFSSTPAWVLVRIIGDTAASFAARAAGGGPSLEVRVVASDLDEGSREWIFGDAPAVSVHGRTADLLAWLTGRGSTSALQATGGSLPSVPAWA